MTKIEKFLRKSLNAKKRSSFYIRKCNSEVLAGYCIDSPTSTIYIWRFVLPSFDRIDFMHLGLGERIVQLGGHAHFDSKIADEIEKDCEIIDYIQNSRDIIKYIERRNITGDYALWVKFLCYIRSGLFVEAENVLISARQRPDFPAIPAVRESLARLENAASSCGWQGAQDVLEEWSLHSEKEFCVK